MKKNNFIVGTLLATILFMVVGYAAFAQQLNITGTASITSTWDIEITNIRGVNDKTITTNSASDLETPSVGSDKVSATFKTGLVSPGDTRIYEVEVSNLGTLDAQVNSIIQEYNVNQAITITYEGMSNTSVLSNDGTFTKTSVSKTEPFALPASSNNIKYIYISVKYNDVTSQPTNTNASFTLRLDASQLTSAIGDSDSTGSATATLAKLNQNVVTTGDGLYKDGDSYVFKGANPSNYITFNNETWRIVSIAPTGEIKIIKDEKLDSGMVFDSENVRPVTTSTYCDNDSWAGCNAWAKMDNFVNGIISGNVESDATLNTYLNGDYEDTLALVSDYIATDMTWNIGASGTYDDTYSIETLKSLESTYTWTGDIALLTESEYMNANANESCLTTSTLNINYDTCKETNYLYKSSYDWWLLSPYPGYSTSVFNVYLDGRVEDGDVYNTGDVRPVLYLKSNVILEGNGTSGDGAYTITGLE